MVMAKEYMEQAYKTAIKVMVRHPDYPGTPPNVHVDWIKGLNRGHALYNAKNNWPGAKVLASKIPDLPDNPLLSRESANKAMDAASREFETPAIRKARVKPIRRGGI
jgi:hypothetical protein